MAGSARVSRLPSVLMTMHATKETANLQLSFVSNQKIVVENKCLVSTL